jgi:hypothetical protein
MYSGDINRYKLNLSTIGATSDLYKDYLNARDIVDPADNVLRVSIANSAEYNYLPFLNSVPLDLLPGNPEE